MPKKRSLSCRLLKDSVRDPADSLKDTSRLVECALHNAARNKRLFVGQAYNKRPSWHSFFSREDQRHFATLRGAQAAAILFVSVTYSIVDDQLVFGRRANSTTRWLAICFGMAFHDFRPEYLESQFGLKVALNSIGQERIRSIDTRQPEEATIQTRSQNSRSGDIFDFGVDTGHIILQAITGKCSDAGFGGMLTGSDALKLNCEVEYQDVDDKVREIFTAYESSAYEDLFPWYGRIVPVRDRQLIQDLDTDLVRRLRAGELGSIHLAPPEIVEYQNIEAFKYSGDDAPDGHDELRISEYLEKFDVPITIENLKSDRVRVKSENDERFFDKWGVYSCLSAEIEYQDSLYVLAGGEWYEVDTDFVRVINAQIDAIPNSNVALVPWISGEAEGVYNERAAREVPGLHFCDKELITFLGERGRIEFCDLLSDARQIVHVKKRSRSSLLSHLFLQGYVSAEAFIDYRGLRQQVRDLIPAARALIPLEPPNPRAYEIVFALMHEGNQSLPFFSKVALTSVHRQLRRLGYSVALRWIPVRAR